MLGLESPNYIEVDDFWHAQIHAYRYGAVGTFCLLAAVLDTNLAGVSGISLPEDGVTKAGNNLATVEGIPHKILYLCFARVSSQLRIHSFLRKTSCIEEPIS